MLENEPLQGHVIVAMTMGDKIAGVYQVSDSRLADATRTWQAVRLSVNAGVCSNYEWSSFFDSEVTSFVMIHNMSRCSYWLEFLRIAKC